MRKALLGIGTAIVALALAACSNTVSGHPRDAVSSGRSGPTGFPSSATASVPPSGGSNGALSADDLAAAAKRAMQSATSFRIDGSAIDGGTRLHLQIHYGETSSDGSVSFQGLTVQLRYIEPDMYMKAGEKFWRTVANIGPSPSASDQQKLNLLRDKWVHLPPGTQGVSGIAKLAVRSEFVKGLDVTGRTFSKGPSKTIDGRPVVSFVDDSDQSVVYVPAEGTPYPVRIESPSASNGGAVDLTDWDVPFTASRPPAGEIVELPH